MVVSVSRLPVVLAEESAFRGRGSKWEGAALRLTPFRRQFVTFPHAGSKPVDRTSCIGKNLTINSAPTLTGKFVDELLTKIKRRLPVKPAHAVYAMETVFSNHYFSSGQTVHANTFGRISQFRCNVNRRSHGASTLTSEVLSVRDKAKRGRLFDKLNTINMFWMTNFQMYWKLCVIHSIISSEII